MGEEFPRFQRGVALILAITVFVTVAAAADGSYGFQRFRYLVTNYDSPKLYIDDTINFTRVADKANAHINDGSANLTSVTTGCTVTSFNTWFTISCTTGGQMQFTVDYSTDSATTNRDTFWLDIIPEYRCLEWYAYMASSSQVLVDGPPSSGSGTGTLYVWAVATPPDDSGELAGTASTGSTKSKQISESMYMMGQRPYVEVADEDGITFTSSEGTWSSTNKYWTFSYKYTVAESIPVKIYSNTASFLGCNVKNKTYELDIRQSSNSFADTTAVDTLASLKIRANPCARNIHYGRVTASTFKHALYTQSSWRYYSVAGITSQITGATNAYEMWPMQDTNLVLTDAGIYYTTDLTSFSLTSGFLTTFNGTPMMTVAESCDRLLDSSNSLSRTNDYVLAWDRTAAGTNVYYSSNNGTSFTSLAISGISMTNGYINQAMAMHRQPYFTLLLYYTTPLQKCAIYNTDTSTWSEGYEFASDLGSSASFTMSIAGTGAIFIYGNQLLFYSKDGCVSATQITLSMRDTTNGPLESGETLTQVASSETGYYAVLTSKVKILVGREGVTEAVDVQSGFANDKFVALFWSSGDTLYAMEATSNSVLDRYTIPWAKSELWTQREPASTNVNYPCPYSTFAANTTEEVYIDYTDDAYSLVSVTSNSSSPVLPVSVVTYSGKLGFGSNTQRSVTYDHNYETNSALMTMSITSYSSLSTSSEQAMQKGAVAIISSPEQTNLRCDDVMAVTPVRIGCPPLTTLTLVSKATVSDCSSWQSGKTFTIENEYYDKDLDGSSEGFWGESGKIAYDYSTYGCPESVFQATTEGYTLQFKLSSNNVDRGYMTYNMVIYEVNGRFDYYMSKSSVTQKKCTYAVTSRALAERSAAECPNEVITFDADGNAENLIFFPTAGGNGVFQFHVYLSDSTASYCDIEGRFAFNVYGAPLKAYWHILITMSTMIFLIMILECSYCYYRYKVLRLQKKRE